MVLKNLEFELRYQMRELVRKEGGAVLMHTDMGLRLMKNLKAIQALKAKRKAA
jgi:hypothetical protein